MATEGIIFRPCALRHTKQEKELKPCSDCSVSGSSSLFPCYLHSLRARTEFGLWISIDGGQRWAQYMGSGFPAVAVRDLLVQPRTSDLVLATHGRGIWIIDDISSLRALTADLMTQDAGFLPMPAAVQWMETSGGWAEGDAAYVGPSRSTEAAISYYQKTRHIFGDMKIEIFDEQGKFVDEVASSKHRGVNRAGWSMHTRPPRVPPAASALFGAATGPRVLPGSYQVKMTRGDKTYSTRLSVVLDPRARFSIEDRRAQFELATRLGRMLNHMSWAVDAIIAVRDGAVDRSARLPGSDALRKELGNLAASVDRFRSRIVATKEGGMITGEERLREFIGGLYGAVNSYEGRPTDSQSARADALNRELEDVIREFTDLAARQLPDVNRRLQAKELESITVPGEKEWQATHLSDSTVAAAGSSTRRD